MPPKPLFDTFPPEILSNIALYLNSASAFSFSLLSRRCAVAAEPAMWRTIDLTSRNGGTGLPKKLQSMMKHGNARRWEMVRSVIATARFDTCHSLLQLLANASNSLESVEIEPDLSITLHPPSATTTFMLDCFDLRFINSGLSLSFPNLLHVHLGLWTIRYIDFADYICSLSPSLLSLDLNIDDDDTENPTPPDWARGLADFRSPSALQSLRLSYCIHRDDTSDTSTYAWDWPIPLQLFRDAVKHHSFVRQLSFHVDMPLEDDEFDPRVLEASDGWPQLADLYWGAKQLDLANMQKAIGESMFPALRRLIMECEGWSMPLLRSSSSTALCWSTSLTRTQFLVTGTPASPFILPPDLGSWLRRHPKLRLFHFTRKLEHKNDLAVFSNVDLLERSGAATGTVNSIRHGEHELLRVRLLMRDVTWPPARKGGEAQVRRKLVAYAEGDDLKYGLSPADLIVVDAVDWNGEAVPVEVIEKMRVVEGASEEEWAKRGVEVGDEAWAVFEEWAREEGLLLE